MGGISMNGLILLLFVVATEANTDTYILTNEGRNLIETQLFTNKSHVQSILSIFDFIDMLEYDTRNECTFMNNDKTLIRQCGNQNYEVLARYAINYLQDISYDWLSETLYFVSTYNGDIDAIDVSPRRPKRPDMWRRRIIAGQEPIYYFFTSIAVHPEHGHLYWTRCDAKRGALYRSNLDGSEQKTLLKTPFILEAKYLSIDYVAGRLYWYDDIIRSIASCDLLGESFRIDYELEWQESMVRIFVHDQGIYFATTPKKYEESRRLWLLDTRVTNATPILLRKEKVEPTKAFTLYGKNGQLDAGPCSRSTCTHLCVGAPNSTFKCLCPSGLDTVAHDDRCRCEFDDDFDCFKLAMNCTGLGDFFCDGRCIDQ